MSWESGEQAMAIVQARENAGTGWEETKGRAGAPCIGSSDLSLVQTGEMG